MEILEKSKYKEYEQFVQNHPMGSFTQSTLWHGAKPEWQGEVIVTRNDSGEITGGMSVLVRRMPNGRMPMGTALLYAPRGPVCDLTDEKVMRDLKKGVDMLAKKHRAYSFKVDPEALISDNAIVNMLGHMGFRRFMGGEGFETVQPRFNYRVYIGGQDEEQVLANMHHKTRYNIRLAGRKGVEVKIVDESYLDEFMRLMQTTGARDDFSVRSKQYFKTMLAALGEHCRMYMAFYEGKAISAAITTNYAKKACYLYGASDNALRNVMPNYLIQWEMIKWALETGCTVYDMQGIPGNYEDESGPMFGLYRFKRGFGGQVDELAGEFDFVYRPIMNWLINAAMSFKDWRNAQRRKKA